MSLYAEYVKEVDCGRDIIEIEDVGFISYYRHPDQIYIEDVYLKPQHRDGKTFERLFNDILDIALKYNIKCITHAIVKTHSDFSKMEARSKKFGFEKVGENDTECCYLRRL